MGVVFAGFALVIVLSSDDYLQWPEETDSGVIGFLSPSTVSVGLQVGALITSILYRSTADYLPHTAEKWFFGVVSVLFFIAALGVVALARSVLMHGVARARGLKIRELRTSRDAETTRPAVLGRRTDRT